MPIGRRRKKDDSRVVPAVVLPNLEELDVRVSLTELMQKNTTCEDIGLECLPFLRKVRVGLWCYGVFEDEVEREEAALRHAIEVHPNRPAFRIEFLFKEHAKRYVPSTQVFLGCKFRPIQP
jgi:hypothetical protein